jgi:hypothetical protein
MGGPECGIRGHAAFQSSRCTHLRNPASHGRGRYPAGNRERHNDTAVRDGDCVAPRTLSAADPAAPRTADPHDTAELTRLTGVTPETARSYLRVTVILPDGRQITGWPPGAAGGQLLEHRLLDKLATQLGGITEAQLPYGRADVLTKDTVFEVEPAEKLAPRRPPGPGLRGAGRPPPCRRPVRHRGRREDARRLRATQRRPVGHPPASPCRLVVVGQADLAAHHGTREMPRYGPAS